MVKTRLYIVEAKWPGGYKIYQMVRAESRPAAVRGILAEYGLPKGSARVVRGVKS